ncbi:DMT family transporter [Haemophilus parahaemolyticus]|uniref:DMT family transporter n=2 Tax=Haemophilus parahaemolyticus TaxID=735 RepID=A0AAE6JRL2_HAEPH|nr:DMT family transporter [Haemophilus parahaemolyticus]EIJ73572.1 EamA-like transporter family protein [Haemophilus parahaemolyticus HK385]OOR96769.1 EamA family transporter [Haemophilus parahaemolyticus]QEN10779.1 DMT family transporter [Haemophilus parahaemolyticus]QRP11969.1 DMT family transporter [Haemophilus parahaemolyticus]STO67272.1 drug/metabolite transporter (DMT) superfamily permease [Haemophilus parahaemolyticus HK385]
MKKNAGLGFCLALLATMMWGTLPIAAQQVLVSLDAQTLVWARFWVAGIGLFLVLGFAKKLPKLTVCNAKHFCLMLLGTLGLSGNFFLVAEGLYYISPTTTQVLWQFSPFLMIFLGVVLFKEPFNLSQKVGFLLLIIGLIAFFNDKFGELLQLNAYALGLILSTAGSLIWVCYGIAQKLLLKQFNSQQILMMIYLSCGIAFSPFASPTQIGEISTPFVWGCFIYCCLNTLIAYGSYGEALSLWDTSKVSVVTTMIPIFTMLFSILGHMIFPETFSRLEMNWISYVGAIVVVLGAMMAAVGHKIFGK